MALTQKEMNALESVGGFGDENFYYINLFEDLKMLVRMTEDGKYFITLLGESSDNNTWSAVEDSLVKTIETAFDNMLNSVKLPKDTIDDIVDTKTELVRLIKEGLV